MNPIKISVVIITFNEENNIRRCLESVKEVADEIVVLDSYSSDETAEICSRYDIKFVQQAFEGHIEQKNAALSHATNDYVLSLDADEALSDNLLKSILSVKANATHDAYNFNRLTYYGHRPIKTSGWYPDQKIRLWNKNLGSWGGINPHDRVMLSEHASLKHLDGDLMHYSFSDFWDYVNRSVKYARISGIAYHQAGETFHFYNLIINPLFRFLRDYFFKRGFTEGYIGLMICAVASFTVFLKYYTFYIVSKEIQYRKSTSLSVMHLSSEKGWRGGEQQIAYLIGELNSLGVNNHVVCRAGSAFHEYCIKKSIPHTSRPFTNSYEVSSAIAIKKLCQKLSIDIVHMHSSRGHSIGFISSLFGNSSKLILSRRVDFPVKGNWFSRWKYNHPNIERIVCVSDKIREVMLPSIKNSSVLHVVHSGVDIGRFEQQGNILREEYTLSHATKIVANISALADHKDYFTFLNSVLEFKKNGIENIKFFIIGDGELRSPIEQYIEAHGLTDDVIMTGFRTDINQIFHEIDVFLMTSKEEGLGTTVLDAFANKVPVVATAGGGIPEMVKHEQTGLLYSVGDAQGLASGVRRVLDDSKFASQLTSNAHHLLSEKFTKERTASKTLDIYQGVVSDEKVKSVQPAVQFRT